MIRTTFVASMWVGWLQLAAVVAMRPQMMSVEGIRSDALVGHILLSDSSNRSREDDAGDEVAEELSHLLEVSVGAHTNTDKGLAQQSSRELRAGSGPAGMSASLGSAGALLERDEHKQGVVPESAVDRVEDTGEAIEKKVGSLVDAAEAKMIGIKLKKLKGPPSSTTRNCVIAIAAFYFMAQTTAVVAKSMEGETGAFVKAVSCGKPVVSLLPMIAILFQVTRLHALHVTRDEPDVYDLPQMWVRWAMYCSTFSALVAWFLLVASTQYFHTRHWLKFLQYAALLVLYGGCVVVCVGVNYMPRPPELWKDGKTPPTGAADVCALALAMVFFLVHFLLQFNQVVSNLMGEFADKTSEIFKYGADLLKPVPSVCLIFIISHMRTTQIFGRELDEIDCEDKMALLVTIAMLINTALAVCLPLYIGGTIRKGKYDHDTTLEYQTYDLLNDALLCIRFLLKKAVVTMSFGILVHTVIDKKENAERPNFPATMACVLLLQALYMGIYLANIVAAPVRKYLQLRGRDAISEALQVSEKLAGGCPLYGSLILGARLRARTLKGLGHCQENIAFVQPSKYVTRSILGLTFCVYVQTGVALLRMMLPKKKAVTKPSRFGKAAAAAPEPDAEEEEEEAEAEARGSAAATSGDDDHFSKLVQLAETSAALGTYALGLVVICSIPLMSVHNVVLLNGEPLIDHCAGLQEERGA
eukprot:TRINITY_DN139_c1_g1_i1.p1 TRINITY_DN139_c1_g1~~TRINITY_DN139_c1_g1_i1.p1  ORF type:complete len:699 (-),score=134.19 TRINITY_DN139_c1_g1_i1:277-2373(-)